MRAYVSAKANKAALKRDTTKTQSFKYESSDINMDVTTMVDAWIYGSTPNEGILLITSDELNPTGSGFVLKFFSRDTNTIYSPYLDVMWDEVAIDGYITGSTITSSVQIVTNESGITSNIQSGSTFSISGGISGVFSASTSLSFLTAETASGFVVGTGLSGNIIGLPIFGFVSASMSETESLVVGPCGNTFSASLVTASFYDGVFSGSTFTAYYVDYKFENAIMTGSWIEAALLDATVSIKLPSNISPYVYATVIGTYVNGTALGTYVASGSTSASFEGRFINGNLIPVIEKIRM